MSIALIMSAYNEGMHLEYEVDFLPRGQVGLNIMNKLVDIPISTSFGNNEFGEVS